MRLLRAVCLLNIEIMPSSNGPWRKVVDERAIMLDDKLKKNAVGGFIWKFSERVCAQLISLIVSIVLARILMPEDYAVVSIVTIFFAFCNVFISGGLNTALIQKKDSDIHDYAVVLYANIAMAFVLYAIMFFSAPFIASIYENDMLINIVRVMGLSFFIDAVKAVLSAYTSSTLQFKKFFFSTIVGTIISAVIGVTMALNGFGAWALVAQQMSNSLIDTIMLFITTRLKVGLEFSWDRFGQLFKYGWKILVASFVSVLYDETNPLIVGVRFSSNDLSFYSKGRSFPSLLDTTVSSSLAAVLFPIMSKIQEDKSHIMDMTRRYSKISSYIIFPLMLGLFSVAKSFVEVVLTDKWVDTVPYIKIFSLSYMFNIIQVGNLEAIKAMGRSDVSLRLEIVKKSVYFAIILIFVLVSDSPEVLAMSSLVCTFVATMVNVSATKRLMGYAVKTQVLDVAPNLLIAIAMAVVVSLMDGLNIPVFVKLAVQIFSGVFIYIGLSIVTNNMSFKYLLQGIKEIARRRVDAEENN